MAGPFTYRFNGGDPDISQSWTSGSQPVPVSTSSQLWGYAKFAASLTTAYKIAQYQFTPEKRGWDYLIGAVRAAEEYSPGHIFRTFQLSHMLSPFEAASRTTRYYPPAVIEQIRGLPGGATWLEDLGRRIGENVSTGRIGSEGFRFERGRLLLGAAGEEVLLPYAQIMRAPTGARPVIQQALARSMAGGPVPGVAGAFSTQMPFRRFVGEELLQTTEAHMILGGKSRLQVFGRAISGYGTSLIERLNQLAKSPAELPGISELFSQIKRIPGLKNFTLGVESSSGLKTLAKLTGKLGLLGTAGYLTYQQLDYYTRRSSIFSGTLLDEGITAGIATLWTRGQKALSRAAEATGAQDYREWQESIAPGSTQISKLATLPIMGALGGLGINYALRVRRQFNLQRAGLSLSQASLAAGAEDEFFRASIYRREIKPEILSALDDRSIQLIRETTNKRVAGWEGRIARRVAATQERRTIPGMLARVLGEISPSRIKWMGGLVAGAALVAPFIPGALVPSNRPEELEALYSGRKRVAIRKGRWWEAGRSPFEGGAIDRFQEHWYPRLLARAKEKSIWGEDEPSPIHRWFIENFTYNLERQHYYDRPYPISGAAFEDIPFIGPVLSTTIGRFVKPPALMHTEEWMRGNETLTPPPKFGEVKMPGEMERGSPISPYGIKGVAGEEIYRFQEMVGLPGFTLASIKEAITGTQDTFAQESMLESARRMYGAEREYWDKDLGGGLGTTELIRRLYPHRRRQIELYNPIRNLMPGWLPGPGERSPDFLHGDPYAKVPLGEERLPGEGYAALHPELQGIKPENYPAFWRYRILADVAPYSDEYKTALAQVRSDMARGRLTPEEREVFRETFKEVAARKVKKEFSPYLFKDRVDTPMERVLAEDNERKKDPAAAPSWFDKTLGTYWETLGHNIETPLESLTPVSPGAKLMHMRTAVEDYEMTQIYGTSNAFWDHPIRDFLAPTLHGLLHSVGSETIPSEVRERRDMDDWFDTLRYMKAEKLERAAQAAGDRDMAEEMAEKKRETLFGVNPFTYNYTQLMRALPRRDRDYFNAFAEADLEERARIYKMLPENEQALMAARWKLKDAGDINKAIDKGLLSEEQVQASEDALEQLYQEKETEGMPKDRELWAEYLATRLAHESYPDWYRRTKLLEKKLAGKPLPGPDWVGWSPTTDLEDIRLKIVQNEGKNLYDYDLWPDRVRAVARRPMLDEAVNELQSSENILQDPEALRRRIQDVLLSHGIERSQITMVPQGAGGNSIDLHIEEDRAQSDKDLIRKSLNG